MSNNLPDAFPPSVPNPHSLQPHASPLDSTYTPLPLTPQTQNPLLNTSAARLECNYRFARLSIEGAPIPIPRGRLYKERLAAQLALNERPPEQHPGHIWNQRRIDAMARGEDPNSELIWRIEHSLPTSHLERLWREVTGKKPTIAAEREYQEKKKRDRKEGQEERGTVRITEMAEGGKDGSRSIKSFGSRLRHRNR